MQKMNKFALVAGLFALSLSATAQQHQPHAGCSMGLHDGQAVKNRMLENRRLAAAGLLPSQRTPNAVTYIPLTITSVANTSGQGHASIDDIFAMVCDLNNDYADQDIQFYIKDSIRFRQNNNLYNDAGSFNSTLYMTQNKVGNTLNIYISPTVQNAVASFYNPAGDFVFIITSVADGTSNTATHEVGHFFSLPHTFYGWEGISYHDTYQNQNAPNFVGGEAVEKVVRTGSSANCATAADGFCDTEADYISDRWPCPYVGQNGVLARDPLGVSINPNEDLYMSYYFDGCVNAFSAEQKAAVADDVASRGWSNLAAPNPSTVVTGLNMNGLSPINNNVVFINGSNNVTLQWDPVAGANQYQVYVERRLLGSPAGTIVNTVVRNATSFSFSSSLMSLPSGSAQHDYIWKVKPMNNYSLCGAFSPEFSFKTSSQPVSVEEANSLAFTMQVSPNPVQGGELQLLIQSQSEDMATVKIYSVDGRLLSQQPKVALNAGQNSLNLDANGLANGLYFIQVSSSKGSQSSRFVVQR